MEPFYSKINLNKRILDLFYSRFEDFNDVQRLAIPEILNGKNTLVIAPTGTGKTECALLPILHHLVESKDKGIHALYITPLRALNRDLLNRIEWWCENLEIPVAVRHGDTSSSERAKQSRSPPKFLITTPETLQALFTGKRLREHLKTVKYVIIDELHELLDSKRGVQLALSLERLVNISGDFQRVALSATIGDPEEAARFIFGNRNYKIISWYKEKKYEIEVLYPKIEKVDEELSKKLGWSPKVSWSVRKIKDILDRNRTAIIFVNTREMAELLVSRFKNLFPDYPIEIHHSSLSREIRERNEKLLREGILKAIVATSSLELGIDIGHVDVVIQYMSPRQACRLLQRVGRAGHKLKEVSKGVIITLDPDDYAESLAVRECVMNYKD
jgi:ATP-dependent Lhr-like helicase